MIAIIDYGMGNLRSVQKAFERVGHAATITSDPAVLADAAKTGAAGRRRVSRRDRGARSRGSWSSRFARRSRPASRFWASAWACNCCSTRSYEDGEHEGLGVVPGEVVRFEVPAEFKVPHMGWNQVRVPPPAADLRRRRRGRALLLRPLLLRRAARRSGRSPPRPTTRSRSVRASGATISSPRSSTRRRARPPACGCSRTSPSWR